MTHLETAVIWLFEEGVTDSHKVPLQLWRQIRIGIKSYPVMGNFDWWMRNAFIRVKELGVINSEFYHGPVSMLAQWYPLKVQRSVSISPLHPIEVKVETLPSNSRGQQRTPFTMDQIWKYRIYFFAADWDWLVPASPEQTHVDLWLENRGLQEIPFDEYMGRMLGS